MIMSTMRTFMFVMLTCLGCFLALLAFTAFMYLVADLLEKDEYDKGKWNE